MTLIHDDDRCSAGMGDGLDWLQEALEKRHDIKTQRVGKGITKKGVTKAPEGQVLNRIVRLTPQGFELEADLGHAELIVEQLDLVDCKAVGTPGIPLPAVSAAEDKEPEEEELPPDEATLLRGIAARCNYPQPDRPDIQHATKEVCRLMSRPTPHAWEM